MRRLARFLPFVLFGLFLLVCYFVLTSMNAPTLIQTVTYQDSPTPIGAPTLRTVTQTTIAHRKKVTLWEAQTSVTFSYNGTLVAVQGAHHEVRTYAPGWNAQFTPPTTQRNQDGTFQLQDQIHFWYGLTVFSHRYEFDTRIVNHTFVLYPDGSVK